MLRVLILAVLCVVGCDKSRQTAEPGIELRIDPRACEPATHRYAWQSGTDRVAVDGVQSSGACKVVVSRESKGATRIFDCQLSSSAPAIVLRRSEGRPFSLASGRLECRQIARANTDGTVTDTRDDHNVYAPF